MTVRSSARRSSPRRRRGRQLELDLPGTWGGARRGAGRKPKNGRPEVRHASRPRLEPRFPVHVTTRVVREAGYLRGFRLYPAIRRALCAARERLGVRIIHFSIQKDHIHLVVEARDQIALGRAMKGFGVRVARRLNRIAGRKGRVIADRYHARYLRTPTEVRRAPWSTFYRTASSTPATRAASPAASACGSILTRPPRISPAGIRAVAAGSRPATRRRIRSTAGSRLRCLWRRLEPGSCASAGSARAARSTPASYPRSTWWKWLIRGATPESIASATARDHEFTAPHGSHPR
jgi:REP element-mobilizing transposase RayT